MIFILEKDPWNGDLQTFIKTDLGENVLRLESRSFTFRRKIILYDRYYVEIGRIEKPVFKSGSGYQIFYDDRVVGTLKKSWSFFRTKYRLVSEKKVSFLFKGKIKDYEFTIVRKGKTVAKVSKEYGMNDAQYGLETKDDLHKFIFLCAAVILSKEVS